jgi:hypothetical protein
MMTLEGCSDGRNYLPNQLLKEAVVERGRNARRKKKVI